jgi:hypothetical protein
MGYLDLVIYPQTGELLTNLHVRAHHLKTTNMTDSGSFIKVPTPEEEERMRKAATESQRKREEARKKREQEQEEARRKQEEEAARKKQVERSRRKKRPERSRIGFSEA